MAIPFRVARSRYISGYESLSFAHARRVSNPLANLLRRARFPDVQLADFEPDDNLFGINMLQNSY